MAARKTVVTVFEVDGYAFSLEEWWDIYQTAEEAGYKTIRVDQTRETYGVGDEAGYRIKTTVKIEGAS